MNQLIIESFDEDYKKYDYHINWLISDVCQLKCSYCFRKKEKILPFSFKNTVETINELNELSKYKKIKVGLTGGEPLIFPYYQLIEDNLNLNIDLELNTNGFLLDDNFNLDRYNLLSISWHTEYFEGLFKKLPILKKINELKKLNINIVYNQNNLELVKKIQKICENENLSYSLVLDIYENKKINIDTKNDNNRKVYALSYENKTYMKNIHNLVYLSKLNKIFQNSLCTNNFITINPDNTVNYSCNIMSIKSIKSLINLQNKIFCKKDICPNLSCFADTTKTVWEKNKIDLLIKS